MKKKISVYNLKEKKELFFIAPLKPFGVFVSCTDQHLHFSCLNIAKTLEPELSENFQTSIRTPLESEKLLFYWSCCSSKLAVIQKNRFLYVFDFKNKCLYGQEHFIKTESWKYYQLNYFKIPSNWFPHLARTQKNYTLEQTCLNAHDKYLQLEVYKEALKTEVLVPISSSEFKNHNILKFNVTTKYVVCAFVNMIAAHTHFPEQEHFKTIPFAELCHCCVDYNIDYVQLYTEQKHAISISQFDMNTLSIGLQKSSGDLFANPYNWLGLFFDDLSRIKTFKPLLESFNETFSLFKEISKVYCLKPKFEESFILLLIVTKKKNFMLPSFFFDRLHQFKQTKKLMLPLECNIEHESEKLTQIIDKKFIPIFS